MNTVQVKSDIMYPYGQFTPVPKGQAQFSKLAFKLSEDWVGVNAIAQFSQGGVTLNCDITAGECFVPEELNVGSVTVYVRGYKAGMPAKYTANGVTLQVVQGGADGGVPPVPPQPDLYSKLLQEVQLANEQSQKSASLSGQAADNSLLASTSARESADNAKLSATNAQKAVEGFDTSVATQTQLFNKNALDKTTAISAEGTKQVGLVATEGATQTAAAKAEADKAAGSAVAAKASETQADASEAEALLSQQKAQQALADLLKIIGVDIATLVGGKIPMSQIPATATQEIYTVTSEAELVGLTAQRGDLAELITVVNGVRTITKTWQLLGTSTVAADWIPWGTAYAVSAGNASTATNADNAGMINNHRMVEMKQADFDTAVKDPTTYYLVTA